MKLVNPFAWPLKSGNKRAKWVCTGHLVLSLTKQLALNAVATLISQFVIRGFIGPTSANSQLIGNELSVPKHLSDVEETSMLSRTLLTVGRVIFNANFTDQYGARGPFTKGRGRNRISGPNANSCQGCHNSPDGISGGAGGFATYVSVLGRRFDFSTLNTSEKLPTSASVQEQVLPIETLANLRASQCLLRAGYLETLAWQITEDLQTIRYAIKPDLPQLSVLSTDCNKPQTPVISLWQQAANIVSLSEFSTTDLNQHHKMQPTEPFGVDTDPNGEDVNKELFRVKITAFSVLHAALQLSDRVISRERRYLIKQKPYGGRPHD